MIEYLRLRNFQRYKRFDLELDPYATVLVGPTDKGKTTCLRALRWLATNRPLGNAFIRHGQKSVSVHLGVDGNTVRRCKGGSEGNTYFLNGSILEAPGTEVPSAVVDLLNLDPNLNFQRQHDPPFWFSLTPGEVAKELNKVVNLELIDRTLANAAAEVRRVKAVIGVGEERLEKAKADAARLAWVQDADAALRDYEGKVTAGQEIASKIASMASILEEVARIGRKLDRLTGAKSSGLAAKAAAEAAMAASSEVETLQEAIQKYTETEEKLCQARERLADAERELAAVKVCPACGKPTTFKVYNGKEKG